MNLLRVALVTVALVASSPAAAQLSTRGIAVESGLAIPAGGAGTLHAPVALSLAIWLDGKVEGVLRLAGGSVRATTAGRAAASWLAGTAGVRWSGASGPVRPQLFLEAGWASATGLHRSDRLALGAGAGVEWFWARDLSLGAALAARRAGDPTLRIDATLAAAVYF